MALFTCRELSFAYEGNVVVSGLDFTVESGDYLCVVGENGSGKSTLIKGLLRLKQPQGGSLPVSEGLKAGDIGYMPQRAENQNNFPAGVFEVVLSGRLNSRGLRPFYTKADKSIALENMERLNISDLKDKCYGELSGGQQQRILLCRALCAAKKVLILDEPASGLDPVAVQDLYGVIKQINSETGITIIMVSHDIQSAVKYASHILHLKNEQVFFGTAGEYKKSAIGMRFIGGEEHD